MANESSGGASILTVLLVVFVVLKLTDNIDWSWLWVLSPFWMPIGLILIVVVVWLPFKLLVDRKRRRESMRQSGWFDK